jgi:hypothetical protein
MILDQQKQFLLDHGGFKDVTEKKYKMPLGPWSSDRKYKDVGRWHLLECYEGIEGWSMAMLTRLMGVSIQKSNPLCLRGYTDYGFPTIVVGCRSSSLSRRDKGLFQGPFDSQLLPRVSFLKSPDQVRLTSLEQVCRLCAETFGRMIGPSFIYPCFWACVK